MYFLIFSIAAIALLGLMVLYPPGCPAAQRSPPQVSEPSQKGENNKAQLSDHDKISRDWSRIETAAKKILARVPEPSTRVPGRQAMIQDAIDILELTRINKKRTV